jgi:hypothetical protein
MMASGWNLYGLRSTLERARHLDIPFHNIAAGEIVQCHRDRLDVGVVG